MGFHRTQQGCQGTRVPVMHGLGRRLGAPWSQMRKGESYWDFMDGMMSDLMVLSRSATTSAQYAG